MAAIGTFLLTVACVRWDRLTLDDVGAAANRSSLFRLAIGFLIGLTLVALWAQISAMAGGVRWVRTASVGGMAPLISLITYLALACREELAFRGYPLRRLYAALGLWPAQIVVAVVFVLEHRLGGYPWVDAVFGSGMGALLFGMAAIATGGLAIPIGIHAAWNFGSWAVGIKGTPGFWRPVVLQAEAERAHIAGTVIYDVLFILATILFWIWHRRRTVIFRDAGSDDTRRQIGKCST
ncbi:MAG: CPBP family intramembrane glutamic endopeptidase [Acidobacteriota bacterium]